MASPSHNKTDDLLKDRKLPSDLIRRFVAAGVTVSEQKAFLDRLEATAPTDEERAQIASAPNPWAILSQLEARSSEPEREARRIKMQRELAVSYAPVDTTCDDESQVVRPKTEPQKRTKRELPSVEKSSLSKQTLPRVADQEESSLALRVFKLQEQQVRNDLHGINVAFSLNAADADPKVLLPPAMLEFYNLLVEALKRFEAQKRIS